MRRTFKHEILNSVLSETPPEPLYHYTDQKGLLGIVKNREIWATHHQCLNDTQEFLHAKGLIGNEIDKRYDTANPNSRALLDRMRSALDGQGNEDLYITSFSQDGGDSLAQWRAYGGAAAGFALGFRADRLVLPDEFTMARCIYEQEKQCEVAKAIVGEVEHLLAQPTLIGSTHREFTTWATLLLALHQFALIFKHEKFQGEKEWRIFSCVPMDVAPDFRQGKSMLIPYRHVPLKDDQNSFPLHEVVVGPNPNKEQSRRSVQSLLNSKGLVAAKARSSDNSLSQLVTDLGRRVVGVKL